MSNAQKRLADALEAGSGDEGAVWIGEWDDGSLCIDGIFNPEKVVEALDAQSALDPEKVRAWLQREFGSFLAHDPSNPDRFWGGSSRSLCKAAKRGDLS